MGRFGANAKGQAYVTATSDNTGVDPPSPGGVRLELFDASGRSVWIGGVAGASEVDVPATGLAPGAYILRASWNDGELVAHLRLTRKR